jgi:3-oxoadipate enol-lactonase
MSFADINGIKICYEIYGKENNYPIILIHGFGAKKEIWKAQVGALSKKFKAIIFDLRGSGKSDRPNTLYTMEMFADDIKGLMEYLHIKKTHLIGRSLGGMIAQHFTLIYPERVNKLVLITTNPGMPDEQGAEMLKKSYLEGLEQLKKDPEKEFWDKARVVFHHKFRKQMEANPKKKFYGIWSVEDRIRESIIDMPRRQDIENRAHAIAKHNTLERLSEIKNKTLLLAASHDRLTPKLSMIEMHKRIPNSTLKIIRDAGHFMTLSRAPEINKIITDFLEN